MTFINILYRGRRMCVGVSALMRRCEFQGLYFQTKFFSNHSQLFSCWSTLRCYVKTLRKDQRIINWKSLDRISTCHLKCMWPRLSPPHILRHSEVRSPVLYLLEHFLGDSNNRIWFSDNQGWSLSRARAGVRLSHVSFSFPHRHRSSGPREGTEFKFKSPLWPSHQLPLTLFEFQCNDASPFFSLPGLPPSDGGDPVTRPGPRAVGDPPPALRWWPLCGPTVGDLSRARHNTQYTQSHTTYFNFKCVQCAPPNMENGL